MTLEQSLSIEADEFRKYLLSFITAGQNAKALGIFHQELFDALLSPATEGYDLTFNSYFQDLLAIGEELFGYHPESLMEELVSDD